MNADRWFQSGPDRAALAVEARELVGVILRWLIILLVNALNG
jgi:hypothetical protein